MTVRTAVGTGSRQAVRGLAWVSAECAGVGLSGACWLWRFRDDARRDRTRNHLATTLGVFGSRRFRRGRPLLAPERGPSSAFHKVFKGHRRGKIIGTLRAMNPYPPPPPRKSNTGLIVTLIVVPLVLIVGCVGAFLAIPALGFGLLSTAPSAHTAQADAEVVGDWASADCRTELSVAKTGLLSLKRPWICTGVLDDVHKQGETRYPFTIKTDGCGKLDAKAGTLKGTVTVDGGKLDLNLGTLSAELTRKS